MRQSLDEKVLPLGKPVIKLPDRSVKLTLAELAFVQSIATCHIAFSVTLACALRCAHCIVRAGPDKAFTTMSVDTARHYARQMKDLAEHGITNISCTGGEPLLAPKQVGILVDAAAEQGISSGIVTSAYWARRPESARRVIKRFRAIKEWDISVDAFHQEFVSLDTIQNAYQAVKDAGHRVTVRFTHSDPPSAADIQILEFITTLEDANFTSQQVRGLGRGADLGVACSHTGNRWMKPCLTQGMVIRYDGSIAPCCLNLIEERQHPFQFGDAAAQPLCKIHDAYLSFPLLQLIRAIGFSECWRWIGEEGLRSRLPADLPHDACDFCSLIMRDPVVSACLTRKTSDPDMRLKIAVAVKRILGETVMLSSVLNELADCADRIQGFEEAKACLAAPAGNSAS